MFQRSGHYNSETEHFSVSEFLELAPQIRALTSGSPQFQFGGGGVGCGRGRACWLSVGWSVGRLASRRGRTQQPFLKVLKSSLKFFKVLRILRTFKNF